MRLDVRLPRVTVTTAAQQVAAAYLISAPAGGLVRERIKEVKSVTVSVVASADVASRDLRMAVSNRTGDVVFSSTRAQYTASQVASLTFAAGMENSGPLSIGTAFLWCCSFPCCFPIEEGDVVQIVFAASAAPAAGDTLDIVCTFETEAR